MSSEHTVFVVTAPDQARSVVDVGFLDDQTATINGEIVELVRAAWACPRCGTRVMDELVPDPDEDGNGDLVRCERCGTRYMLEFSK